MGRRPGDLVKDACSELNKACEAVEDLRRFRWQQDDWIST